ncbi:DinB family protein [Cohnella nanjingensis]|uniref:DinB family protein n=1 Tax=Cohnella nanjingensis TaxID=1387779 RepID=UPI0028AFA6E3|nr:DinB family protein [Cohnella nanjingensis]
MKKHTGGIGGILYTLFHVVTVEYNWICEMEEKPEYHYPFEEYAALQNVQALSDRFHDEVKSFISSWNSHLESRVLTTITDGEPESFKYGEIMRHLIAHEIHHEGQLSVWSRELGKAPITANLIRRGLF